MKIPTFLKDLSRDLTKDLIKWILLAIFGGGIIIVFLKKIIAFLNQSLNLPIWLFITCLILVYLIGHGISRIKKSKKKISFKDYGDVSWKVETHPDGYTLVEKNPHCPECHTGLLIVQRPSFREISFRCPKTGCKNFGKEIHTNEYKLETLYDAVKKVVEADTKQYAKK